MSDVFWTEVRIAEMLSLKGAGYSASEIGRAIGTTRNAVLGKLHRMQHPPAKRDACIVRPKVSRKQFHLKLAVGFDQSTADRVATIARERGQSRGQVIRDLVETGLYVDESFQ